LVSDLENSCSENRVGVEHDSVIHTQH